MLNRDMIEVISLDNKKLTRRATGLEFNARQDAVQNLAEQKNVCNVFHEFSLAASLPTLSSGTDVM